MKKGIKLQVIVSILASVLSIGATIASIRAFKKTDEIKETVKVESSVEGTDSTDEAASVFRWNEITEEKKDAYYVCNGVSSPSWGTITYLEEYAGAEDVYKVTTVGEHKQINGIVIKAAYEKTYYENILTMDKDAMLCIDVYWSVDELKGAKVLQTNDKYNHGISNYPEKTWNTLRIPLAALVINWDILGAASATAGTLVSIGDGATNNYSFYVSNLRIVATP